MSVEQLLELHDRERRVRRRVSADNLVLQANVYGKAAYAWLQEAKGRRVGQRDRTLAEALRIAEDDAHFISVKVEAALESRFRHHEGEFGLFHRDPGELANLALALIERSEQAWRTISRATEEEVPASLAHQLAELRALVEAEFPGASNSPRPGSPALQRLEASGGNVASLEARITALEGKIDALTRGMRQLHKQVLPQARRKG